MKGKPQTIWLNNQVTKLYDLYPEYINSFYNWKTDKQIKFGQKISIDTSSNEIMDGK